MNSPSLLETEEPRESTVTPAGQITTELSAPLTATGDRCPNCAARMAPDQRYCINCGQRRTGGGLRDTMQRTQTVVAQPVAVAPRRARMSPNSSLIAGIGTLLLAMGVGVLIGRTGDHPTRAAAATPVQVVRVEGSGAGGSTTAATDTSAATNANSKKSSSAKKKKHAKASTTTQTKAQAKAQLPPPVVKVGAPGHGKGYSHGKFTGTFFGQ